MKVFSALAALALTAATSFVAPASANQPRYRVQYTPEGWSLLRRTLENHDVQYWIDSKHCNEEGSKILGMAVREKSKKMHMLICRDNHHGNYNEMADTFRHEVVHLIQFCKGERYGATTATLYPENAAWGLAYARDQLGMPVDSYSKDKWEREAEARVMAYFLNEEEIASQFTEQCSYRRLAGV